MAVDQTLIQGAYRANAPQKLVGVEGISKITDSITGAVKDYIDAESAQKAVLNAEWDKYAEDVLNNSDLVGDQYEALYDDVMSGKSDYANADKKGRDLIKRNLASMADDYDEYKTLREDVAINLDDYSPAFKSSPEGQAYLEILKGDGKKLIQQDGRLGIEVNGEFKSISSIKQELDQNKIDDTSIEALESFRVVAKDSTKPFDREGTERDIMNNLVSKGSYKSLKNDEIIPGRTFIKDLQEKLESNTYKDLEITDEYFKDNEGNPIEGVNSDNKITSVEAKNIIAHLEKDEDLMKKIMTEYYTNYIEQNSSNVIDPAKNGGYTKEEAENLQQTLVDAGYDIEVDGRWGPETQEAYDKFQKNIPPSANETDEQEGTTEGGSVNEDGEFVRNETDESKSAIGETDPFKSRLEKDGFESSKVSDEDILAYFKDMEGKLKSDIYNSANFSQWLKNNNKKRLEFNY